MYFRGTLVRKIKNQNHTFFVRYDDGDGYDVDLNEFQWRYAKVDPEDPKDAHLMDFEFMSGDLDDCKLDCDAAARTSDVLSSFSKEAFSEDPQFETEESGGKGAPDLIHEVPSVDQFDGHRHGPRQDGHRFSVGMKRSNAMQRRYRKPTRLCRQSIASMTSGRQDISPRSIAFDGKGEGIHTHGPMGLQSRDILVTENRTRPRHKTGERLGSSISKGMHLKGISPMSWKKRIIQAFLPSVRNF